MGVESEQPAYKSSTREGTSTRLLCFVFICMGDRRSWNSNDPQSCRGLSQCEVETTDPWVWCQNNQPTNYAPGKG